MADAYSSGMRGKQKPSKDLESISITPAENGFSVSCYHKPKGNKAPWGGPPTVSVFESVEAVLKYVEKELGEK